MIHVDFGDGVIHEMDERRLEGPFRLVDDNENQRTVTVEYRLHGKTVHRSTHVTLKKGLGIEALMGRFHG
ncbi:MAG TPA: hypothetical protein VMU47_06640 [Caldimonas sp.]|nr:hypothetical protein [Caldimonas sp.]